ncbi:ABC transporter ATP-binding protein [Chelatococcus reniformis]|uniref:ABC transporter ATP-binding protein n=1 Tax=Chelatococcus reniformis TaxID=1494448 RepID=A0A916U8A8_9HYPH|nr:ABC transporter ATP-binding protein [Chelatococcus reniformis]GGC63152.1 ABC transporter ATP-binding protein [Chelatococcus reniformis]
MSLLADAFRPSRGSSLLRPVRAPLCLAILVQVLSSALILSPLVGVTELARTLLADEAGRSRHAWSIVAWSVGGLAAGLALRGLVQLTTHLADNALSLHLRRRLAERLSRAPIGWFTANSSGRVRQAMQDDVAAIHHLVAHSYVDLTDAMATTSFVYAYLAWVDWRMALVALVPVLVFAVLYARVMAACGEEQMARYGRELERVSHAVVEFAQGIPVVKSYGRQGEAHAAYRRAVDDFRSFFRAWARPLIEPETLASIAIAPVTLLLLVLGCGVALTGLGWVEPWQVLPFAVIGLGISVPIVTLSSGAQALQTARAAAARLDALLALPVQPAPAGRQRPAGRELVLEHVCFSFGEREILKDVSLRLSPGTVTALVGPSGSGKSTLAKLLLGLDRPSGGRITLGGVDLQDIETDYFHGQIGFVPQEVRLLRTSIRDNIALGRPDASDAEVEAAAVAADIHRRILKLPRGYQSVYGEDAGLSGGEAQRLSIARALLLDPPILVLDEATAQADAEAEAAIQDGVRALIADSPHRTVLIITHRLGAIKGADTIVVLADGAIVEAGAHEALTRRDGAYARMWRALDTSTGSTAAA